MPSCLGFPMLGSFDPVCQGRQPHGCDHRDRSPAYPKWWGHPTGKESGMATMAADKALQDWAAHWSSHDMDALLGIFTDDCIYEDVTLGVVNHGKAELTAFARGFFTAFPDFHVELRSRFDAGDW